MRSLSLGKRPAPWLLLVFLALPTSGAAQESKPAPSKAVADSLRPFVENRALAGAVVLVASKDKVLCLEAVGYSDLEAHSLMGPRQLFWIASMSKPITATALMLLVDEGKVRLDDPVEKYLPEFKGVWLAAERDNEHVLLKHPKRPVTLRDLLRHTSGMPFASALERPTLDMLPLRVAVGSYALTPLQYEPGSKYQYSNAGINTAGRIIEVVSGMPYEDFLQKRLFDPLGMRDTTFRPDAEQLKRLAKSYRPMEKADGLVETQIGQLTYPLNDRRRQPMPAGGLFSTAEDMGRFCRMVLGGGVFEGKRYLSEAAVKEMTSRQTGEGIRESYGLGWATGGGTFGHGGAFATNMTIDPQRGLVLVFLVQHAGFSKEGSKSLGAFRKAAEKQFGSPVG
jgi:CubicO group peptidase (beta-lactamase class C family)